MNWIEELYTLDKWKKYSQANEEAYLSHILNSLKLKSKFIVDLGAGDGYTLSNSRYFIENGYEALLIDADNKGNADVKQEFITKENIVDIFKNNRVPKNLALLSIDLDGNDLYILEEILKKYTPSVIVAEFNPKFKPNESYAIRYDENHRWGEDDFYGFSFAAGVKIARKYEYTCIFQNDDLNMYFVLNDLIDVKIPEVKYNHEIAYHIKSTKTDWVEI